jgi:4-hydroxybenzoyl-CoA thioesterase
VIRLAKHVRFEEVDAAGIVFFARYLNYCHEAMEHFFAGLDGGYVKLIRERHLGLPAVKAEVEYFSPLRYGDAFFIDTSIDHIGTTSCVLSYRIWREQADREIECAKIRHTCVVCSFPAVTKVAIPQDMRALMAAHPTR